MPELIVRASIKRSVATDAKSVGLSRTETLSMRWNAITMTTRKRATESHRRLRSVEEAARRWRSTGSERGTVLFIVSRRSFEAASLSGTLLKKDKPRFGVCLCTRSQNGSATIPQWSMRRGPGRWLVEVLLYVHRNRRLIMLLYVHRNRRLIRVSPGVILCDWLGSKH